MGRICRILQGPAAGCVRWHKLAVPGRRWNRRAWIALAIGAVFILIAGASVSAATMPCSGRNFQLRRREHPRLHGGDSPIHRFALLRDAADHGRSWLAFGFRAGLFNIGGAGQIMFGSLAAIWVAFKLDLPFGLHTLVALVAAAMAGGLYAGIAGFLKARTGADSDRDDHVETRSSLRLPTRCPCRRPSALATTTR